MHIMYINFAPLKSNLDSAIDMYIIDKKKRNIHIIKNWKKKKKKKNCPHLKYKWMGKNNVKKWMCERIKALSFMSSRFISLSLF